MFCRLLGPLEVRADNGWTSLSAPKWRALLAMLALHPGQIVPTPRLAGELWGDNLPRSARKLVSDYVARLRQVIGDPDGLVLVTAAPGYRLQVARSELDVTRFEQLVAEARLALEQARGEDGADLLGEALALWRGPALADVPLGSVISAEAARLDELRLDALELQIEARICQGRAAEFVAELRQLAARYPLRERLWHQLMRALEQSGRPAEALEAYALVQGILADELGADPGSDLRQLHRRLLAGSQAPAALHGGASPVVAAEVAGVAVAAVVLRQLPAAATHFTGRAGELAALTGLLDQVGADRPGTVVISAIDGMPGVGKTALAVQAGHLLAGHFPDWQLFVDLHGHSPDQEPAAPADVLAALLTASGVDPRYLPASLDGRAALWRDRLAGQRALLILDNAASSVQIAPLLPGTAGSLVLVTSRRFLGDLPAALEVPLNVLPPGEGAAMFTELASRPSADPDQVAELVELCGGLPLAISLLARLLTRHRSWTLADLISQSRARLLMVAAENRTVAAAFEASYQDLDAERQRFFRYLSLHPGPEIDALAAAALAGISPVAAAAQLDALHGDRLVEEPAPCRYQLHDLIRQYARSLAAGDCDDERQQAVDRLLDYYQQAALAADAHLTRRPRMVAAGGATAPAAVPRLPDRGRAQAWLAAERANLMACIDYAMARGDLIRMTALIAAIAAHLRSDGPWPVAFALHTAAARAAGHLGDRRGHADALLNLADIQYLTSDNQDAATALAQARGIYRDLGDRLGEANALYGLGIVEQQLAGGFSGAIDLLEQALRRYRGIGARLGEANALSSLGIVRRLAGDYSGAVGPLEQALEIHRAIGDLSGEANALRGLGAVRQLTSDYPAAARLQAEALVISRSIGDRQGEGFALFGLGSVRQLTGDYPGAALALEQALSIHRRVGSRRGEAYACSQLGDTRLAMGDTSDAARLLERSLDICRHIGDRAGEAYALLGLGRVRRAVGHLLDASGGLDQALGIFRQLGDQGGEAEALNEMGAVHLARADPLRSRACHQRALELARAIGARLEEARALEGIGKCAARLCDASSADGALREALEIYQQLGVPEAVRLRAELETSLAAEPALTCSSAMIRS